MNQVNEQYTFDPLTGLLTNQKAIRNGLELMNLSYDFARNSSAGSTNPAWKTGALTGIMNNLDHNKDRVYQYDAIGRLVTAKGGVGGSLSTQTYQYDRFGNRTSVTATGVAADGSFMPRDGISGATYNATSNRITTAGWEYDAAGNQTRGLAENQVDWLRYEYDAANRLVTIKQDNGTLLQSQEFGADNLRISVTDYVSNQRTFFDGLVEYTEFGGNGVLQWSRIFVYLGQRLLSTIVPAGSSAELTEYDHPDRLGTRLVTNQQTGSNYEQIALPFGTALNAESGGSTSRRFTSYERSERTGLDYAQNRTYDSKQGRFTQVDPIGMQAVNLGNPQTLNLYNYVGNDPINRTDPSGLFWGFLKKLFKWILVAIAIIVAVLTIIAAPATLAGILGAISAGAAAGSSVMNALGYSTAAKVLGWIAIGTGIGAGIAAMQAGSNQSLIIKNFASTAEKTTPIWQRILGGISAVGAIANSFAGKPRKRPGRFQTVDQAAIFWLRVWNPYSISHNIEVAAMICEVKKTGELIIGNDDFGSAAGSNPPACPSGSIAVGIVHTHAAYDPNYDNENFSGNSGDRGFSNTQSLRAGGSAPIYVATPSGVIKKFKPSAIAGSARGKVITFKSRTSVP